MPTTRNKQITVKSMPDLAASHSASHGICLALSAVPRDFPLHGHDYYELELILSGRGTQWINGQASLLAPGCFYLLRPTDLHRLQVEEPLELYNLKIAAAPLPPDLRGLLETRPGPTAACLVPEVFQQVAQDIRRLQIEICRQRIYGEKRQQSLLQLLLTDLFRAAPPDLMAVQDNPSFRRFSVCLHYIREHYQSPVSLKETAAAAGLTPNYLSHLFPELAGCQFVAYVTHLRLNLAVSLLSTTDDSVTAVAFASGFGSLAHFLRTFHKQYGLTPGQYRQQQTRM